MTHVRAALAVAGSVSYPSTGMDARRFVVATLVVALYLGASAPATARPSLDWPGLGHDPQHSAVSVATGRRPLHVRWSTPVDLAPQYSGTSLLIHYGSPLITRRNTVIVTVKTGANDGFKVEGRAGDNGALVWTEPTDYALPPHNWVPSVGPVLARGRTLLIPGEGGTVFRRSRPDRPTGSIRRYAFYGIAAYEADPATFAATVRVTTPLTADRRGNVYFGFTASDGAPLGLASGIARLSRSGRGTWVSAASAAADASMQQVPYGSAPALSADGRRLYVAVRDASATGYLVALDSVTLTSISRVRLRDAKDPGQLAFLSNDGTASPTVGPDGDVYFGVLGATSNHFRGWMLHFGADLQTTKTAGAFGWDDTPSIVPAAAVAAYAGTSSYLLLTKYNDYAGAGGTGQNRMAILDPFATMVDPISGTTVMRDVLTVVGSTPDAEFPGNPLAVREWCINTAAVDPTTRSAFVNNEDGKLYRWDLATGTLADQVVLTPGLGEAYTPTLIGPDGTVYAINNATLFAVDEGPQPTASTGR
jgi:hypothetical protein